MPDIIKTKRSLKDVLPHQIGGRGYRGGGNNLPPEDAPPPRPKNLNWPPRRRWGNRFLVITVLAIIVAFGGFLISNSLAKVIVKITPIQGRLLLNHTFDAFLEPSENELGFSLVSGSTDTESRLVPASGSEKVSRKASGVITIFNNYDEKPQRLVANTRFETPDGKTYRIASAVTVPGTTMKNGERLPGSIDATVTADQPGEQYNIDLTDFTIPGFKGDPRFDKFYARSKTPMTGGYEGEIKKVSPADKAKAEAELKEIIASRLINEVKLQIPDGFVLFDDAYFLTFEEALPAGGGSGEAEIKLTGTFHGIIFNRLALSRKVATDQIPDFDGRDLEISNLDNLNFKLLNREAITGPEISKVSFTLEGNAHLVWIFDQAELVGKLRSAPKENYQAAFAQFPTIKEAELVFFPPWVKRIPDDANKIKIEVVIDR